LQVVRLATMPIREVGIVTVRNLSHSPAAASFREFVGSSRIRFTGSRLVVD
jgi:hypothetical protein